MPTLIRNELACAVLIAVVGAASALGCSKKICDGPAIVDGLDGGMDAGANAPDGDDRSS
jgi:hypothetical protein